jgi:hypothetical protein
VKAGPSEQPAFATGPKDDRCLDFGSKVDAGIEDGVLAEGERLDFAVADEGGARFASPRSCGILILRAGSGHLCRRLDAGFLELLDDVGFGLGAGPGCRYRAFHAVIGEDVDVVAYQRKEILP